MNAIGKTLLLLALVTSANAYADNSCANLTALDGSYGREADHFDVNLKVSDDCKTISIHQARFGVDSNKGEVNNSQLEIGVPHVSVRMIGIRIANLNVKVETLVTFSGSALKVERTVSYQSLKRDNSPDGQYIAQEKVEQILFKDNHGNLKVSQDLKIPKFSNDDSDLDQNSTKQAFTLAPGSSWDGNVFQSNGEIANTDE